MIRDYSESFSSLLIAIQRLVGIDAAKNKGAHESHLELTEMVFWQAFDELHENSFWLGSDVLTRFILCCGETLGGGYKYNECNKRTAAFDINLTLYKNFKIDYLLDIRTNYELSQYTEPYRGIIRGYMLLNKDTCKEIVIFPRCIEAEYEIKFRDAGVVTCSVDNKDVPVGLDSLTREFLIYESAYKLSLNLNVPLANNFEYQYNKVKDRLGAKTAIRVESPTHKIWQGARHGRY